MSQLSRLDLPIVGTASFAALGLTTGLRAIYAPTAFATTFGLPQDTKSTQSTNAFIPVVGARNMAGAASLLTFCYLRDRRAIGVSLVCGVITGLTDAVVCYRDGVKDNAYGHAGISVLLGSLGAYILLQE